MPSYIEVRGANENNLKNVDVDIPHGLICGICGVSGSGKSTLAKNIIVESGLKNFSYGLPSFMRNRVYSGRRPDVSSVENLPPVLLIDVKNASRSSRSTVATTSGLMSVLRNIYCQYAKDVGGNKQSAPRLFSYNIAQENGGGACEYCEGKGVAETMRKEKLIVDEKKSLNGGGVRFVTEKGVKYTKITEKFVDAFCREFQIDGDRPIAELPKEKVELLLYGSDRIISFNDRSGANSGKKSMAFPGIAGALLDVFSRSKNEKIGEVLSVGNCPKCSGSRYSQKARSYLLNGKKISDVLSMTISEAKLFVASLDEKEYSGVVGLKNEFVELCDVIETTGAGYLNLSRAIASVSGGELQRIRLSKNICSGLNECCIVLDEPSTGLHPTDIGKLIQTIYYLKERGNTVLLIEHNLQMLKLCDYIIEMGELGGKYGGRVIAKGSISDFIKENTKTANLLANPLSVNSSENGSKDNINEYIKLSNINANNLVNVELMIPLKKFIAIVGVSGSGKSTAINTVLGSVMENRLQGVKRQEIPVEIRGEIKSFTLLSQDQPVQNSRSSVGTLLEIMDDIRDIYAGLPDSREAGLDKSYFSLNSKNGVCAICGGSGAVSDEAGEFEEICPVCGGKKFTEDVLRIKYSGLNIHEILSADIQSLTEAFTDNKKLSSIIKACVDAGIGYLSLGRTAPSLSKGEYQRIRIVKEICREKTEETLFVFDEPSKGLHGSDLSHIINSLRELVKKGHTVVAIEHNVNVIAQSDYVIEFGPGAGTNGGKIIFSGCVRDLLTADTPTAQGLAGNVRCPASAETVKDAFSNTVMYAKGISGVNSVNDIELKTKAINVLRGGMASGKSSILSKALFAVPYKKYMANISTQGKYLAKDVEVLSVREDTLRLSRLIDVNSRFYKKYERIVDLLDLNYYISNVFYKHGNGYCPGCGHQLENKSAFGICAFCGKDLELVVHKSTFDMSKKTSKCPICQGAGIIESYSFDEICSNSESERQLYDLLNKRTRYPRIMPLLKKEYGIDIGKKYSDMTAEEKEFFVFGDKTLSVAYKDKLYHWDGVNNLVNSNMSYAADGFINRYKPEFKSKTCPHCFGKALEDYYLNISYGGFRFEELLYSPINSVIKRLSLADGASVEKEEILRRLKEMDKLGLGNLALSDFLSSLPLSRLSIVQYLSYKFNPLYGTAILWDDFSAGKSRDIIKSLIDDFKALNKSGVTVVLGESAFDLDGYADKVITLGGIIPQKTFEAQDVIQKGKCNIISGVMTGIDRINTRLSVKTSVATLSDTISRIRDAFKKKNGKITYSLSNEEAQCEKCKGSGYYEINSGKLGITQKICPECNGSGFSRAVLSVKLNGKNIADIYSMTIAEVRLWLEATELGACAKNVRVFERLGLSELQYGRAITNVSYSQATLMILGKFILGDEKELKLKNAFLNISDAELENIRNNLEELCKEYGKTVDLRLAD